jgi:hypothetical protein
MAFDAGHECRGLVKIWDHLFLIFFGCTKNPVIMGRMHSIMQVELEGQFWRWVFLYGPTGWFRRAKAFTFQYLPV